ncbi:CoA-binding protein [soil metagenome]
MTPSAQGSAASPEWRTHLISDDEGIAALLARTKRIAVLGIKTADAASQPAYYVPAYAQKAGYEIIPVPVYYPDATEILGERVYRAVSDIPEPVDMVDIFRRPADINAHLGDILSAQPKAVWFQLGIRNEAAAEQLARAGIDVVQDRCLLVELRNTGR